jgi:nucleotide-binding universal stress UspA family protein
MSEIASTHPEAKLIVVGVDGSEGARDALRWALHEATIREARVRAVYAWGYPILTGFEGTVVALDPVDLESTARAHLDAIVHATCSSTEEAATVEQVTPSGTPADALINESKAADLVVVGARGKGGFLGLRLGSVSSQVAHHAHCPVVITRHETP